MLPLYAVRSRCQAESSGFFSLGQLQLQPQLPASSSISSGDIGLQASSAPNTAFHIGQSSLGSDTPHIAGHGAPLRGVIVVGQPSLSMQSNIITSCNPWYALRSKCQALLCPCRGQPYANRQTAWERGYLTVSAGCKIRASHLWEISAQAVRGKGAATPQEVSSRLLALLAMEESKRNQTHNGGSLLGGISPRPALAIPPPAKTKESTTKGQRKNKQTTNKGRLRERGVIEPFWDTFIHIRKAVVLRSNSTKIQKLYLAKNHIKRYNKSTRRLQPSGA